jgi:16S rRNA (uracil1498-N3)-methyltransferase
MDPFTVDSKSHEFLLRKTNKHEGKRKRDHAKGKRNIPEKNVSFVISPFVVFEWTRRDIMCSMDRVFYDGLSDRNVGDEFFLGESDSHHMVAVRHCRPGSVLLLFDGEGHEAEARMVSFEGRRIFCSVLRLIAPRPRPSPAIALAVSPPKGKRWDWLLQKATELGITRLIPLAARRGVRNFAGKKGKSEERWRRITIEACKQCGLSHLPRIDAWTPFDRALLESREYDLKLIASPGENALPLREVLGGSPPVRIIGLIGPEGGFTDEEADTATSAGFQSVRLSPTVLRIETAALALLSVLVCRYR